MIFEAGALSHPFVETLYAAPDLQSSLNAELAPATVTPVPPLYGASPSPGETLIDRINAGTLKAPPPTVDPLIVDSKPFVQPLSIGYNPPAVLRAASDLSAPTSASDSTPTTLPTVTVTGTSMLPRNWYFLGAIVLLVVLGALYFRSRH